MLTNEFRPDWASAPGETITDILHERKLSVSEFAQLILLSDEDVGDLLIGRSFITMETARQLEKVLGGSVEFWMSRDYQYHQEITRIKDEAEWLNELPVEDMINWGWIGKVYQKSERVSECLRFFDVPSISLWKESYSDLLQMAEFRISNTSKPHPASVAAWLRQGEIEADSILSKPWNPLIFRKALDLIRSITIIKDPKYFLPRLKEICAECGVAVVIVRSPSGCPASGATWFVSSHKAILLLSFRYLTDDQFWFTFFHEAAHLLLHRETGLILEGFDSITSDKEQEANKFSEDILIPPNYRSALLNLNIKKHELIRFSIDLGISPGIVVGQLQHLGKLRFDQLNSLKRHYKWE